MGDNSKIEWTDATWNPIRARDLGTGKTGHWCAHVSEGCRNCYAERLQKRFGQTVPFAAQCRDEVEIMLDDEVLTQPRRWRRGRKIFVCSMTDLFGDWVSDAMILAVLDVIRSTGFDGGSNCGRIPGEHTYQVLTKRPRRMRDIMRRLRFDSYAPAGRPALYLADDDKRPVILKNLWLGVSVEDQATANARIPVLLDTPAAVRFVSAEPLLGAVDLTDLMVSLPGGAEHWNALDSVEAADAEPGAPHTVLDWVIVGGESGPGARPMHPDWARSLRDQCEAAGVPFFFKQWGEWLDEDTAYAHDLKCIADGPPPGGMYRVGKKIAGRVLDGRMHNGFPEHRP